jgi:hypothetical protein
VRRGNSPSRNEMLVSQQEQRVEYNRFGEGDRENSMHKNLREGAWVSADRCRHSQAGETDADSYTHRGEADVNASAHFCQ